MTALLNSLSSVMTAWGPSLVVKATLTLVLTLLVVRLARESRAAVRHLWLTAGFSVLLALPLAPALVPSVRVEVMPVLSVIEEYIAEPPAIETLPASIGASSQKSAPTAPRWTPTLTEILTAVWLGGLLVFLMPVVVGVVQVRRFRRNGLPWLDGLRVVNALAREAGLRRPVDVALHESIGAPATCGIGRHAILFPIDARTWPDEEIARAAVHELEHVLRADCLVNTFARVMCAVYWFHPLAWTAWRRLELEAERACDDAVLRRAEPTTYADQLVTLAGRLSANTRHPLLAMANRSDLVQRVSAVLDPRQARGHASLTVATGIVVAACVLIIGISPLQAVPRPPAQAPGAAPASSSLTFEVASVKANAPGERARGYGYNFESGTLRLANQTLKMMISAAYSEPFGLFFPDERLSGGPDWLDDARFTIEARAGRPVTAAEMGAMLQALLADRFRLRTRVEPRDEQVYHLVAAKSDGSLGPNLRPFGAGGDKPSRMGIAGGAGSYQLAGATMELLTNVLREVVGRPVVNQTGLVGSFDGKLEWAPAAEELARRPDAADQEFAVGVSIFTALQEQFGLKLESRRGPVNYLVIESAEPPTPNDAPRP